MNFSKKYLLLAITILLLFTSMPIHAASMNAPTNDFYVNDFAGVLSEDTYHTIMSIGPTLADQANTQIVVVTLDSIDGQDVEMYATELYREYGIGDAKESRGLLILLVVEDRKIRVEVGDGLEGLLNDGKVGRIMDTYMIPYLANDQWDEGILNGYLAFVQEVKEAYAVDIDSKEPFGYEREDDEEVADWVVAVFIGVVIVSFALGLLRIKIFSVSTTKIALIWLGLSTILFSIFMGIAVGIGILLVSTIFFAIGRKSSPKPGQYVPSDSEDDWRDDDRRYRSSSSSYSSGSSSRSYSGGGGTSSGGGATRGF